MTPRKPATTATTRVLRSHTKVQPYSAKAVKAKSKKRCPRRDPWTRKPKPNPNYKPRTHATCRICAEEQTVNQFPTWVSRNRRNMVSLQAGTGNVPPDCVEHLGRNPNRRKIDPVCRSCIGWAMAARLDTLGARFVGIGCMEPGCSTPWNWDSIMHYMPPGEPLEKFNLAMFQVWKQDAGDAIVTCIAPGCGAMGWAQVDSPGYPQVSCHSCAFRFCVRCLVPEHKGLTCFEHRATTVDDMMSDTEKETLQLMQTKDGKRCPNCYLVIEKAGGCDSMLCGGCHKYFNWATAASAILGAKKAEPWTHEDPYMHTADAVSIVCEMDAVQKSTMAAATTVPVVS
ncbi:hypothetical protein ACEQ8H_006015 [Pleosporales sp. CAS-2024a]